MKRMVPYVLLLALFGSMLGAFFASAPSFGPMKAFAQSVPLTVPGPGTGYPPGAVPVVSTITGAITSAFLLGLPTSTAGLQGRLVYICGFAMSGLGATALNSNFVTIGNLTGSISWVYTMPAGATVAAVPVAQNFSPCLPAYQTYQQITVAYTGAAGNTITAMGAWGYTVLQ